ncbi:GTPase Era [Aestuariivirga litoralis]|uniref:GTPase Era n=1 Tax=Aestuariivirga litoralis TaxID=2650924 RepID=UPI0018C7A686|nr:GTPase Era [Aestuariivirga litoralis]MBG1231304.1 GTPase Era [Aestuariivirga litoralis]
MTAVEATTKRCGFAAILGAPNAGKSTLVNKLIGTKISIVSHKVQTTRARIRAIYMNGQSQVVLVDTPGIFKPRRKLDEAMVGNAWGGATEADAVALMVDARHITDEVKEIIETIKAQNLKAMLILNKIDLVPAEKLLPISEELNALYPFTETFMVSAQTGSGVEKLGSRLAALMPEGEWLYPEDQTADLNLRFLASEITREKIYERLHEELPYASTVETETWEERKDGSVKIQQVVFVARDSQKAIVLGKGGAQIKLLGQLARAEMEESFGRKVHLFLFVKVRENWAEDPERLRMMGLEL